MYKVIVTASRTDTTVPFYHNSNTGQLEMELIGEIRAKIAGLTHVSTISEDGLTVTGDYEFPTEADFIKFKEDIIVALPDHVSNRAAYYALHNQTVTTTTF